MDRKFAGALFLAVCADLAVLMLTGIITPLVGSSAFAWSWSCWDSSWEGSESG